MKTIDTIIISGFPGTGKSYFHNGDYAPQDFSCDSDSSEFDKKHFPQNYIDHIKSKIGIVKYCFVSSHKEVRQALIENKIPFTLIYPSIELKDEYIKRYSKRGSNNEFIKLINNNWNNWISECVDQKMCKHIVLKSGQYMSNINLEI